MCDTGGPASRSRAHARGASFSLTPTTCIQALIRAARLASELRRAKSDADGLGITVEGDVNVDFGKVRRAGR